MNREGAHEYLLDAVIAGRLVVASNGSGLSLRPRFALERGDFPWKKSSLTFPCVGHLSQDQGAPVVSAAASSGSAMYPQSAFG